MNTEIRELTVCRTLVIAVVALAAVSIPVEASQAFGRGGMQYFRPHVVTVNPAARYVTPRFRRGLVATPALKKLSPKAAWACFRACMHGLDASWDNFCAVSCD